MKKCAFGAFLGGALVGAAVALLLAPEKGEDTRRKIKNFIDKEVYDIEDTAEYIRDMAEEKIEEIAEAVDSAAKKVKRRVNG